MRHFSQGLVASMEEAQNEVAELGDTEAAEVAVSVADETAEIQGASDEIGTTVSEVEEAVQGGEELETIADIATDAVESGEGLSEESAELASVAIENIRSRLGFDTSTRLVPATESFGNTNTRMTSTNLVLLGIGDSLKKIWTSIKAAAARLWEMLKSFFAGLFNSAGMLSKHIAALSERARKMDSGVKPKDKKIKHSGVARAFSVKGKADMSTVEDIAKNTEQLVAVALRVGEQQKAVAVAASALAAGEVTEAAVKAFVSSQATGADSALKAASMFGNIDASLAAQVTKGAKQKKGSKTENFAYGPFVGNVALSCNVFESEILGAKAKRVSMSFVPMSGKVAGEVEALDLNQVRNILGKATKLTNDLKDFKKVQDNYDAVTKQITKVADAVMNNAEKILDKTGSSSETRQGFQEAKTEINDSIKALGAFGNRAPALQFQLAKAMADYASISMRNLG